MPYTIAIVDPAAEIRLEMVRVLRKSYPRFMIVDFACMQSFELWHDGFDGDLALLCTGVEPLQNIKRVVRRFSLISHAAPANLCEPLFARLLEAGWNGTRCNELTAFSWIPGYWGLFVIASIGPESDFFDGSNHFEGLTSN